MEKKEKINICQICQNLLKYLRKTQHISNKNFQKKKMKNNLREVFKRISKIILL